MYCVPDVLYVVTARNTEHAIRGQGQGMVDKRGERLCQMLEHG